MSVSSSFTRAPPVTWASSPLERALIARIAVRSGVPDCAATSRSFDRVLQRIANEPRIPLDLHREIVCLEVEHGDKPLDIACMEAVAAGDALLLKTLHQHFNADLSTCDPSNGVTLLHTAAFRGDHDILSYLLQHTSNHQVRTLQASLTVAHWAAQGGSLTCLSLLHQHNIELLRVQDCVGNTPLHYAAQFGHADAVEFLISLNEHLDQLHNSHSPSMIDIQNLRGLTPLHWAAFGNHDRAASVLLCEGASVDIVDAEGRTPLHLAAARGSMQVALKLFESDVAGVLDMKDAEGLTAQQLAEQFEHSNMARLLQVQETLGEWPWSMARALPCIAKPSRDYAMLPPLIYVLACTLLIVHSTYLSHLQSRSASWLPWSVLGAFMLWLWCSLIDPGHVTHSDRTNPVSHYVTISGTASNAEASQLSYTELLLTGQHHKICTTCRTVRLPRMKHCRSCGQCVSRMDHHCVWLNNCVGSRNHRQFVVMLILVVASCSMHLGLLFQSLHPMWLSIPLLCIDVFGVLFAGALLVVNIRHIALNRTTNEGESGWRYYYLTSHSGDRRVNPFDRGSWLANCWSFWSASRDEPVNMRMHALSDLETRRAERRLHASHHKDQNDTVVSLRQRSAWLCGPFGVCMGVLYHAEDAIEAVGEQSDIDYFSADEWKLPSAEHVVNVDVPLDSPPELSEADRITRSLRMALDMSDNSYMVSNSTMKKSDQVAVKRSQRSNVNSS